MNLPSGKTTKNNCALLCADIVNYTELTENNEVRTHELLTQRFSAIEEIVSSKQGSIVRLRGDSVMATFSSTEEALYCAAEIQTAAINLNNHLEIEEQIHFRIAISYGQVMIDEGEPYGIEVNVTARLQELASPDEIYLSEQARNQLTRYVPFTIEYVTITRVASVKQATKIFKISGLPKQNYKSPKMLNKWLRIESVNANSLVKLSIALSASSLVALALTIGLLVFEYSPVRNNSIDYLLTSEINQKTNNKNQSVASEIYDTRNNETINNLLTQATSHLIDGKLILPKERNALDIYRKILELEKNNKDAKFGISKIYQHHISLAKDQLDKKEYEAAAKNVITAQSISPEKSDAYLLKIQLLRLRHTEKITALNEMQKLLEKQYENELKHYQEDQIKRAEYELLNEKLVERNEHLEAKLSVQLAELKKQQNINQMVFSDAQNIALLNRENNFDDRVKILLNINISKATNAYGHNAAHVSQWLTKELTDAIDLYNLNGNSRIEIAAVNTNIGAKKKVYKAHCSNFKFKDSKKHNNVIIGINLLANAVWWEGLQFSIFNCKTKIISKAFIPGFTPISSSTSEPWVSKELRGDLHDIVHSLIDEAVNKTDSEKV